MRGNQPGLPGLLSPQSGRSCVPPVRTQSMAEYETWFTQSQHLSHYAQHRQRKGLQMMQGCTLPDRQSYL
eukprot:1160013-Pelagomonas_calceolata.AAC.4